jgi:hypothetical protein
VQETHPLRSTGGVVDGDDRLHAYADKATAASRGASRRPLQPSMCRSLEKLRILRVSPRSPG